MECLKDLSNEGCTILCVIHQPSCAVFSMFEDLVLLSEGLVTYAGPCSGVIPHFALTGHPCPEGVSPAEHCLSIVSVNHESPETVTLPPLASRHPPPLLLLFGHLVFCICSVCHLKQGSAAATPLQEKASRNRVSMLADAFSRNVMPSLPSGLYAGHLIAALFPLRHHLASAPAPVPFPIPVPVLLHVFPC